MLTPSFHFSVLASFIDIFNEQAQILTEKFRTLNGQKSVDIFPMVTYCTLDVICGNYFSATKPHAMTIIGN